MVENALCCTVRRGALENAFLERRGPVLDVFVGTGHGLSGEAGDQAWNAWAEKGYTIAAADARSTNEMEDGKHTSAGVMEGLEEQEGRIAQI